MSRFESAIAKLKATYFQLPKQFFTSLRFFSESPLEKALDVYHVTEPTEDQVLAVVAALQSHQYSDNRLVGFKKDLLAIMNTSSNVECPTSDYQIQGWLLAELHYYWCDRYHRQWLLHQQPDIDAEEYSTKIQALYLLKSKNFLEVSSFKKVIESSTAIASTILLLKDLVNSNNLQALFCLPHFYDEETGYGFNRPLFVKTELSKNSSVITQDLLDSVIATAWTKYKQEKGTTEQDSFVVVSSSDPTTAAVTLAKGPK